MKDKKQPPRSRKKAPYTTGQLNSLIDDVCHPFFNENPGFILVDGILHGMVEKDPPESFRKFVRYNLPQIVKEIARKRKQS
jgi:ATP-dependent RNA circularization protein (DNA/RNA ligase family)